MSLNMFFLVSGPSPSSYLPLTIVTPALPPSRSSSFARSSWSRVSILPFIPVDGALATVFTVASAARSAFGIDCAFVLAVDVGWEAVADDVGGAGFEDVLDEADSRPNKRPKRDGRCEDVESMRVANIGLNAGRDAALIADVAVFAVSIV